MKTVLKFSDVLKTRAFVSKINSNPVDDNYEVEASEVFSDPTGKPDSLMQYNFVDPSLRPIIIDVNSELKKLPDNSHLLGSYSVMDAFGECVYLDLANTVPFCFESLEAKIKGLRFYRFFISYNEGETSYNAPSVITLSEPEENLNLQILKIIADDLNLTLEDDGQHYATTPNFMAASIGIIEEINCQQFHHFKELFPNHAYCG